MIADDVLEPNTMKLVRSLPNVMNWWRHLWFVKLLNNRQD